MGLQHIFPWWEIFLIIFQADSLSLSISVSRITHIKCKNINTTQLAMNKLPSSADCLLFVWDDLSPAVEGRKSELRPVCSLVCLKIFARWVEKYFRIQCPAWCCLVVLLSSFTNRNRSVDWLHQFSWECKKCCEFQFLHKNNRETYAVKKTKTAPTSLTRTTDYTNPTSRCLILLDPTA